MNFTSEFFCEMLFGNTLYILSNFFAHCERLLNFWLFHDYLMILNKMIQAEAYLEPNRTSTMEPFAKIVNSF